MYSVLMIMGSTPLLPPLTAEYVEVKNDKLMCGNPLSKTYPMIPTSIVNVRMADDQISTNKAASFFLILTGESTLL
jgi:hypothetical protein